MTILHHLINGYLIYEPSLQCAHDLGSQGLLHTCGNIDSSHMPSRYDCSIETSPHLTDCRSPRQWHWLSIPLYGAFDGTHKRVSAWPYAVMHSHQSPPSMGYLRASDPYDREHTFRERFRRFLLGFSPSIKRLGISRGMFVFISSGPSAGTANEALVSWLSGMVTRAWRKCACRPCKG